MAAALCSPVVLAQYPQARLSSVSRPGVRAGETAEVTLRGGDLEGASALWFDHSGLSAVHGKDLTFRISAGPEVPLGHHDLRAVGTYGVSNPRTIVVGDRPESIEVEPNNAPDKAGAIVVNSVINGEINGAADVDCFSLDGKKGQRLFVDVAAERIDSRLDATIRILTPAGTELAESRDVFGLDPFLDVTLPADGRYVIKVHDATYAGSADHVYRLTVHDGPHLDAVLPAAIGPGAAPEFTVIGRGLGAGAVIDPLLTTEGRALERLILPNVVRDAALLASDPGAQARSFVNPSAAVPRLGVDFGYVRVNSSGAMPVVSNSFFVARSMNPVVVEREPNDDEAHAQLVVPPCDITGTFAPRGDNDFFRFAGRKGELWWIEALAERIGSMADPAILIQKVGAKGQPAQDLVSGDDLPDSGAGPRFNTQTVDAAVRWQVPEDGLYQVLISDLYSSQRGHPRLTYRLVIRREQPDYSVVLLPNSPAGADAVTVRAGGRTSAYVAVIRRDGFAGPVRVEARALPPGVTARPVTVGANQAIAPIVFEATENAQNAVGTATVAGLSRFGDRKDELQFLAGVSPQGPSLERTAVSGGMIWPPSPTAPAVAPARVVNAFVVAVRSDAAPLSIAAVPGSIVLSQGRLCYLNVSITRRAGFTEAVSVDATDLPPSTLARPVPIAKEAKTGLYPFFVGKDLAPGIYTFVLRGTGAYPFNKDPKAKERPNINLIEPSNPITVLIRPSPVNMTVNNKGGALKQGGSLEIEVNIVRQNGCAGPIGLSLVSGAELKLSAAPVSVGAAQTLAKLVIQAAKDSPPGEAIAVVVRAAASVRGEVIEADEAVGVVISK
jgi:Bacterial pre-peptidase C-terminal domain